MDMALEGGRKPENFNSKQRWQFSSSGFIAMLQAGGIKIKWSGRKRCNDKTVVDRLLKTSSIKRFICVTIATAGSLKSTWPASRRGTDK
jgi:hypothetical protein